MPIIKKYWIITLKHPRSTILTMVKSLHVLRSALSFGFTVHKLYAFLFADDFLNETLKGTKQNHIYILKFLCPACKGKINATA